MPITKAYDTVDRERLFLLLGDYGLGPQCLNVLRAAWADSLLVPKKGGRYGNPLNTGRGVRQGDIISPTLFNIIIDCILRYEQSQSQAASGSSDSIVPAVCFYADDGCIAGTDADRLQQSLDTIVDGFNRMGIQVNRR